jgi:hypothetical protein
MIAPQDQSDQNDLRTPEDTRVQKNLIVSFTISPALRVLPPTDSTVRPTAAAKVQ